MRRLRPVIVITGAVVCLLFSVTNAGATADPLWNKQYGPTQIGAPTAWQKSTGKGVTVAIIDSGVDVDHPDLKPQLDMANSYDFGCNDANPDDDSVVRDGEGKLVKGHGTHVAGTAAAATNNNIGVAGVAPDSKIMALKVFPTDDSCGSLVSVVSATPQAINWAVDRGAKVINLSLSSFQIAGLAGAIETPCNQAYTRGALCILAAGNSGETRSSGYPYDLNALVVTANDSSGAHATFGQKADTKWAVSAPGVAVLNTWPLDDPAHDGYNSIQGTSMAAPHAAGAAALLFGAGMNITQVVDRLVNTAGPARDSTVEGAGLIHVERALGLESPASAAAAGTGGGAGNASSSGGRAGGRQAAAGGSSAIAPTTTVPSTGRTPVSGVSFEEGLEEGDTESFDDLRLREASRNSANKPFNVVGPLVIISAVAGAAMLALAIPRLRSKDSPPLT